MYNNKWFDPRLKEASGRIFEEASPVLKDKLGGVLGERMVFLSETRTGTIIHNMCLDKQEKKNSCLEQLAAYIVKKDIVPIYFCWIQRRYQQKREASSYSTLIVAEDDQHVATLCKTKRSDTLRYVVFVTIKKQYRSQKQSA